MATFKIFPLSDGDLPLAKFDLAQFKIGRLESKEAGSLLGHHENPRRGAIIVDAAQYVFGYINVQKALARPDQRFPRDWSRALRTYCFKAKQIFAYAAALFLLIAVASRLL